MPCPACGQRKAKRACPALAQTICSVCCATKRGVEINCPEDCVHLTATREHPAAIVRRQQERDVAVLLPSIRHQPDGFARLNDEDVAEAAATVAATLETASRGVIYEHSAQSPVAQRLGKELQATLEQMRQQGATVYDREAAIALRAIEQGARDARTADSTPTAYLELMGRLLQVNRLAQGAGEPDTTKPASSIVLP